MIRINKKQNGFTLVELLVVMGIIAILIGLLFPAIGAARKAARKAQAQTEVRTIATAIEAYYNEYGKYPVPDGVQGLGEDPPHSTLCNSMPAYNTADTKDEEGFKDIIKILSAATDPATGNPAKLSIGTYNGGNTVEDANPRDIVFLEAQSYEEPGTYLDPWGSNYIAKIDCDYNGKVEWFSGGNGSLSETITKGCVVYSLGPEGVAPGDKIVLPNDEFKDIVASHFNE